jgi:NAD(P)H-dependent FMN reductase
MAQIALFVGSVRRDRQGIKVARWMEEMLTARGHTVYFIDPLELNLPLLDRMYKEMENPPSMLRNLQNKIKNAEGYLAVTPEYNHSTSAAMKNTLDYFLEEYFFKPSAIATQHLRLIFAELGAPSISSSFAISRVREAFDDTGKLIGEQYNKRITKFLDEFEWYIEAFKNQRLKGVPY